MGQNLFNEPVAVEERLRVISPADIQAATVGTYYSETLDIAAIQKVVNDANTATPGTHTTADLFQVTTTGGVVLEYDAISDGFGGIVLRRESVAPYGFRQVYTAAQIALLPDSGTFFKPGSEFGVIDGSTVQNYIVGVDGVGGSYNLDESEGGTTSTNTGAGITEPQATSIATALDAARATAQATIDGVQNTKLQELEDALPSHAAYVIPATAFVKPEDGLTSEVIEWLAEPAQAAIGVSDTLYYATPRHISGSARNERRWDVKANRVPVRQSDNSRPTYWDVNLTTADVHPGAAWRFNTSGDDVYEGYLSASGDGSIGIDESFPISPAQVDKLFNSVAALVADAATPDTYEDGAPLGVLQGGFVYEVASQGVSNHHITTAGGTKLYVRPAYVGLRGPVWPLEAMSIDLSGATDESDKLQALFDYASANGGGQLYHRSGNIACGGVIGRANVGLLGAGPASLFTRAGSTNMIRWQDAEVKNIFIESCSFDLETSASLGGADDGAGGSGDFATCIRFDDFRTDGSEFESNDVHVFKCHFFNSNKGTSGDWTLAALQMRGVNGYTVYDNTADGVQFKLSGGGTNTIGANISGNYFTDSQAYCISVVVTGGGTSQLKDVVIENNTFKDFLRGGVFVGYDSGSGGALTMENVVIRNNFFRAGDFETVKGFGGDIRDGIFIIYRMPSSGGKGGYLIEGNTFIVPEGISAGSAAIFTSGGSGDDRLIVRSNTFEIAGDIDRIISHGDRVHLLDNSSFGNVSLVFNTYADTSLCIGNIFNGGGTGSYRIISDNDITSVFICKNTWLDCHLPFGFETGLIRFRPEQGVDLKGLVRDNVVINRLASTVTEAFVTEQDNNDIGTNSWNIIYENNHIGSGIKLFDSQETSLKNIIGNYIADDEYRLSPPTKVNGAQSQIALSVDPTDPDAGESVTWVSDGVGSGDAGDVMMKINIGGVVKTATLVDYSTA